MPRAQGVQCQRFLRRSRLKSPGMPCLPTAVYGPCVPRHLGAAYRSPAAAGDRFLLTVVAWDPAQVVVAALASGHGVQAALKWPGFPG